MKKVSFVGVPKGLLIISLILGTIVYLVKEHPIAFWCLYVPLILIMVTSFIRLLTGRRGQLGNIVTILFVFIVMIGALPVVTMHDSPKCEHEETVKKYSFAAYNSTAQHDVCDYCKTCKTRRSTYFVFKDELVDKSYLEAIVEHSDGSEIVAGEYYTVTAIVPLGLYSTSSDKIRIGCRVENDEFIVSFSADFREEFRGMLGTVEEGEEITFRGRFYDKGCGFTDCELIIE